VPDAGGLVIATDQNAARSYAKTLHSITGEPAVVVLSDDEGANERIEDFAAGTQRWMVAVRMVSEGVDVPRLAVGVYATATATPLFFAQAVGRFVRARRRGETASVFLPSVQHLLGLAGELEVERDHALDRVKTAEEKGTFYTPEDALVAAANRSEKASDDLMLPGFEALEAQATFDKVLFDGGEFGTGAEVGSVEEQEYLGLPGLLDPEQVTALLRARQAEQIKAQKRQAKAQSVRHQNAGVDDHRRRAAARKELNALVSAWARRSGKPHGVVHTELRTTCGGPEVALARTDEIEARITLLRKWFVGRG
jgi:superfamily II DNA/RNA helicase